MVQRAPLPVDDSPKSRKAQPAEPEAEEEKKQEISSSSLASESNHSESEFSQFSFDLGEFHDTAYFARLVIHDIVDQAFALASNTQKIIAKANRLHRDKIEAQKAIFARALRNVLDLSGRSPEDAPDNYSYTFSGLLAQNPNTKASLFARKLDELPEDFKVICVVYQKK